jgi:hypothetical protein
MAVRAKFRCHSITLTQASRTKDGLTWDPTIHKYKDSEGNEVSSTDAYEEWQQPTVQLYAVTPSGSEENSKFFAATPSAECKLTISNPDAAEFYELGKEYYLDFSPAGT